MNNAILVTMSLEELRALILDTLKERAAPLQPSQGEIICREELAKRLNITETTIITWQKKGKIPALKIGAQYRYNWPAVIKALEEKKGGKPI